MTNGVNRLLNTMAGAGRDTVSGLSYGTVININPLIITREGEDSRVPLTAGFLVLSRICKPFSISTAIHFHETPAGTSSTELETLLIWPGLSIGERVILLSFDGDQKFFVERIEFPI